MLMIRQAGDDPVNWQLLTMLITSLPADDLLQATSIAPSSSIEEIRTLLLATVNRCAANTTQGVEPIVAATPDEETALEILNALGVLRVVGGVIEDR